MSHLIQQDSTVANTALAKILSLQDDRISVQLIENPVSSVYTILKSNILSNGFIYEDEYLQPGQILKLYPSRNTIQGELRDLSIFPGNIISISLHKFNIEYILNGAPTKLFEIPIDKLKGSETITVGTALKVYVSVERVVGFALVKTSICGDVVSDTVNSAICSYRLASAPEIGMLKTDRTQVPEGSASESKGKLYDGLLLYCGKLQKQHKKLLKLIKKGIKNNGVLDIPSLSQYLSKTPDLSSYPGLSSGTPRKFTRANDKIVGIAQKIKNSSISLRICQICSKPSREFQLGCRHFICKEDLRKYLSEKVELKVSDWDYSYTLYAPCMLCSYNLTEPELKTIMDLDVSSLVAEQVESIKREVLKNNQISSTVMHMQMSQCLRCMQYKQREAFNYQKKCSCIMCNECYISSNSAYNCELCCYRPNQAYPIGTSPFHTIIRQGGMSWGSSNLPGAREP